MTIANLQSEIAECGHACIAEAAKRLGADIDLPRLRSVYPPSTRGTSVGEILDIAGKLGMSARAVRCEPSEVKDLKRFSILFWRGDHFVMLERPTASGVRIFDPAVGYLTVSTRSFAEDFSGVAIELTGAPVFTKKAQPSRMALSGLFRWSPDLAAGLAQVLVLSIILQVCLLASPLYMQLAIDAAAIKGDHGLLVSLGVGFGLLAIFNMLAQALRGFALQRISALLNWDMTQRLFHHLIRLPLSWFQRRKLADVLSRFSSLDPIRGLVSSGLISSVLDGVLSAASLVMMFVFCWPLALLTVVGVTIAVIIKVATVPITMRLQMEQLQATIAEQGKRLETLRGIQTIKAMGAEAPRESVWLNKLSAAINAEQKSRSASLAVTIAQDAIEALVLVATIYLGVRQVINAELTVGALYAFMAYGTQFTQRCATFFDQYIHWRLLDMHAFRLSDVVLTPKEDGIDRPCADLATVAGRVELSNIVYRYNLNEAPTLKGLNLLVEPGEFIAIVGPSGAGKSTIVKILAGLYTPFNGEVRLDDVPYAAWGPRSVRAAIGVVLQEDRLMSGTIAENVAFFCEPIDYAKLWRCLRQAGIDEEVRSMPMQEHTPVGDMGSQLSGGQRQRLLLARALYKEPKILLLDEATSHLDTKRENIINKNIADLNLTRIVIAHRRETIALAERVLRISDGKLFDVTEKKSRTMA